MLMVMVMVTVTTMLMTPQGSFLPPVRKAVPFASGFHRCKAFQEVPTCSALPVPTLRQVYAGHQFKLTLQWFSHIFKQAHIFINK